MLDIISIIHPSDYANNIIYIMMFNTNLIVFLAGIQESV